MANNPYVNKVEYGGSTLIDLTGDTVAPDKLLQGYTAHDASGAPIVGTAVIPSAAISVVDTMDPAGGTIRTITGHVGTYETWTITYRDGTSEDKVVMVE